MAELNSQISALLSAGADAMDNLFDVSIDLPPALTSLIPGGMPGGRVPFTLRCMGFTPPKFTLKTYDAPYKTMKVKRAGGKIEGERSFQLQFRLDAYYTVYRLLLAWRSAQMQASSGFASNAVDTYDGNNNSFLGSIFVSAADSPVAQQLGKGYDAEGVSRGEISAQTAAQGVSVGLGWVFQDAWIMDMENPKFTTGAGEIQLISVTFGFGNYIDSQAYDFTYGESKTYQNMIPDTTGVSLQASINAGIAAASAANAATGLARLQAAHGGGNTGASSASMAADKAAAAAANKARL